MDKMRIMWPTIIIVGGIVGSLLALRYPGVMWRSTVLGGAAIISMGFAFLMPALSPDGTFSLIAQWVFISGAAFFIAAEAWMRWKERRRGADGVRTVM